LMTLPQRNVVCSLDVSLEQECVIVIAVVLCASSAF
jgi:hypothetical protein